jgi:hypothetical protein
MTVSMPKNPTAADPKFPAMIFSVLVGRQNPAEQDDLWQVGDIVPGSTSDPLAIVAIFPSDEDGIDVFALPTKGSVMHQSAQAVIFNLQQSTIRQTMTVVGGDVWHRMMRTLKETNTDQFVAGIAAKWTGIPAELIFEHLSEAREELKEDENENEDEEMVPAMTAPPQAPQEQAPPQLPPNGSVS